MNKETVEVGKKMNLSDSDDLITRYKRAEKLEHAAFVEEMVLNALVYPNWIGKSNNFWYVRTTDSGKEFRIINAEAKTNQRAFDHSRLARALQEATGQEIDDADLPISQVSIGATSNTINFSSFDKKWSFSDDKGHCSEVTAQSVDGLMSPDKKKAVFLRDHNLWSKDVETGLEQPQTDDGELHFAYGVLPERTLLVPGAYGAGLVIPDGLWSPDSRYFLTVKTDERKVLALTTNWYVPQEDTVRPKSTQLKYGLPGDDKIAEYQIHIVDIEAGEVRRANYPAVPDAVMWASLFSGNRVWWSKDGVKAYFVDVSRGMKTARVVELDASSGDTRVLFEETSDTYLELGFEFESGASLMPLPETEELIWWSERSGWAHLYLYDLQTGNLKNTITSGEWIVREVLHFDMERREVFIQAAGRVAKRDPYYREVCRVNIDTGEIATLASGDCDFVTYKPGTMAVFAAVGVFGKATGASAGIAPTSDFFVSTRTRIDTAPVTELRDRNGAVIMEVETADVSGLPNGWQWPEPVSMTSTDGASEIYGVIFRPTDFTPEKKYPIIDIAFTNPFYAGVPKGAFNTDTMLGYFYMSAAAYAELGFIVVMIDGRGSCYRDKAFHDHAYGQVHKGSDLADHVAGITQLTERYPYMDLDRVGILDNGGSYGPVTGMLQYPDFYKVGAVTSIWDPRLVMQGDIYQGPDADYEQSAPGHLVENLKGKLLLIQGMLDPFFQPAGMFQLVDALVKANKDFDMLMLPTGGHAWDTNCYGHRRMWDYVIRHLKGVEPPANFSLMSATEFSRWKRLQQ